MTCIFPSWFHFSIFVLVYTTKVKAFFAGADWLVGKWQASTIQLRLAKETKLRVKSLISDQLSVYRQTSTDYLVLVWYILKELFSSSRGGYLPPLRGDYLLNVNINPMKSAYVWPESGKNMTITGWHPHFHLRYWRLLRNLYLAQSLVGCDHVFALYGAPTGWNAEWKAGV